MFIGNLTKYDGLLLHHRFAYQYFRNECNPIGDIIIFRGEMEVLQEGMIDQEDVISQAFIWSKDAINILWELPVLGNDPFGAVAYQRLFNTQIANLLSQENYLNKPVQMHGDDMIVGSINEAHCKASVSITHVKDHAALGHTGINISAGEQAPPIAYSTQLSDEKVRKFCDEVIQMFYTLNQGIFIATTKVLIGESHV